MLYKRTKFAIVSKATVLSSIKILIYQVKTKSDRG